MGQVRRESKRYRWYVLGMLALTYAFGFMDRWVLLAASAMYWRTAQALRNLDG